MADILIIGFGNPLRGDDGFGWHVAQSLKKQLPRGDVAILTAHQPLPEFAQVLSRASYVIFVDASAAPLPEELALIELQAAEDSGNAFSHALSPQALLNMARTLYGSSPRAAFLVTAYAHTLGYQERLSPQIARTAERAVERIRALCEFLSPSAFSAAGKAQSFERGQYA